MSDEPATKTMESMVDGAADSHMKQLKGWLMGGPLLYHQPHTAIFRATHSLLSACPSALTISPFYPVGLPINHLYLAVG